MEPWSFDLLLGNRSIQCNRVASRQQGELDRHGQGSVLRGGAGCGPEYAAVSRWKWHNIPDGRWIGWLLLLLKSCVFTKVHNLNNVAAPLYTGRIGRGLQLHWQFGYQVNWDKNSNEFEYHSHTSLHINRFLCGFICASLCQSIKIKQTNMYIASARAQFKINTHGCWNCPVQPRACHWDCVFRHNFSGMKWRCWTTGSWRCCLSQEVVRSMPAGSTIIYRFLCGFICVSLCQSIKIKPTNVVMQSWVKIFVRCYMSALCSSMSLFTFMFVDNSRSWMRWIATQQALVLMMYIMALFPESARSVMWGSVTTATPAMAVPPMSPDSSRYTNTYSNLGVGAGGGLCFTPRNTEPRFLSQGCIFGKNSLAKGIFFFRSP